MSVHLRGSRIHALFAMDRRRSRDRDERRRSPRSRRSASPPRDRGRRRSPSRSRSRSRDRDYNQTKVDGGGRRERELPPPRPQGGKDNPNLMPLMSKGDDGGRVAREGSAGKDGPPAKEKPNYGASGLLAAEQNSYKGVVIKYGEPPEARKPTKKWRLYVFKGKEQVDLLHIHRQSAYLIGRERLVVDIPVDHPSCSKQHAVLQFRQIVEKNEFGDTKKMTKPYIIDLESTNGVFVNGSQIPAARYFELKEGDVIKFGSSTREYVLMCEEGNLDD